MKRLVSIFAPLRSAVAATMLLAASVACADVLTIDFNGLPSGASNSAVQQYMQSVLSQNGFHGTVTVQGVRGEATYTGDNHVVGPMINGHVRPMTLGTTDAGVLHSGLDTFLVNRDDADRIVLTFSAPIYFLAFDYEIFPNGDVPDGRVPGVTYPDFALLADGATVIHTFGEMPGQTGSLAGFPASPLMNPEVAPQFLGTSGPLTFPNGVTRLEFVDWPVRIGIDNLQLDPNANNLPEPGSIVAFAAAIAGVWLIRRGQHRSPPLALA